MERGQLPLRAIVLALAAVTLTLLLVVPGGAYHLLGENPRCPTDTDGDTDGRILEAVSAPTTHRLPCFQFSRDIGRRSDAPGSGLLLGALLPLHNSSRDANSSTCTGARAELIVELVEALKLAVREALATRKLARQAIRGVEVHDSCGMVEAAVEGAVELGTRSNQASRMCLGGGGQAGCGNNAAEGHLEDQRVIAVVGPAFSTVLEGVAPVLSGYQLLHTTFWAASESLSPKRDYPFLYRTVASDNYQATALLDIIDHFKWKYLYLLHDSATSGQFSIGDAFRNQARFRDVCLGLDERIHYQNPDHISEVLDLMHAAAVRARGGEMLAPTVIAFMAGSRYLKEVFRVMESKADNSSKSNDSSFANWIENHHFIWIASDGWISAALEIMHGSVSLGHHSVVGTSFNVPRSSQEVRAFEKRLLKHLSSVYPSPDLLQTNPWLAIAWQDTFNCRLAFLNCSNMPCGTKNECNTSMSVTEAFGLKAGNMSVPVSSGSLWLAVQATVNVIELALQKVEKQNLSVADIHAVAALDMRRMMQQDTWQCFTNTSNQAGECQTFLPNQDVTESFKIQGLSQPNGVDWILQDIGEWSNISHMPDLWAERFSHPLDAWADALLIRLPDSVCSLNCSAGSTMITASVEFQAGDIQRPGSCCWTCQPCTHNTYHDPSSDSCRPCPAGTLAVNNHRACSQLNEFYVDFESIPAIIIMFLSLVCLVFSVLCGIVLWRNRGTLLVRLAELNPSLLLIVSVCCGIVTTPLLYTRPTVLWCDLSAVFLYSNVVFSMIILNCRVFRLVVVSDAEGRAGMWKWLVRLSHRISANEVHQLLYILSLQMLVFIVLVVNQLAIPGQPNRRIDIGNDKQDVFCDRSLVSIIAGVTIWVSLQVSFLLLCYKVRNLKQVAPRGALGLPNEGTLLSFTAVTLIVIWVAFGSTSYLTARVTSPVVTSISYLLHQVSIMACMFAGRVYTILRSKHTLKYSLSRTTLRTIRGGTPRPLTPRRHSNPSTPTMPSPQRKASVTSASSDFPPMYIASPVGSDGIEDNGEVIAVLGGSPASYASMPNGLRGNSLFPHESIFASGRLLTTRAMSLPVNIRDIEGSGISGKFHTNGTIPRTPKSASKTGRTSKMAMQWMVSSV